MPSRVIPYYAHATPAGEGLDQLAVAVPDVDRWTGRPAMFAAIAAATVAAQASFKAFGLRAIPPDNDGREPRIQAGDRLQPSRRHNERGEPIEGLHRGTACFGFHDRPTLMAAIEAVAWHEGRQVAMIGGAGALRCSEPRTRIVLQATVIRVWLRRYSDLGRCCDRLEHADYD